ncbi:MAG TPA: efflux RND transporter periplasmic adaptor subunit [Phycisphaerae bacterium]|nr:efflux RND transporter periplasmic adaptor subunit [Phycisphaerae bacterium]
MPDDAGPPKAAAQPSRLRRAWWLLELVQVRLRFIFLMAIVGLVVGYWENITNHVDRWLRPAQAPDLVAAAEVEYFCPMHPAVIRAEPGSCPICGMPLSKRPKGEHVPLPEGVLARTQLTPLKVRMGRIASTPVEYRLLSREIRTVGVVDYDETRRAFIAARIKGRIDKLLVNYVGQYVNAGDPLVWLYSPELLTAQQELLLAQRRLATTSGPSEFAEATGQSLLEAARQKLLLWGITAEQIDALLKRGEPETHLTIYSPIAGFVTVKNVLEGHYVNEGDDLYTIADLSSVWMQVKVFEDESAGVAVGTAVEVRCTAYPQALFAGRITFIAYEVDPATRTVAARVEIANPDFKLKPGMYAEAYIRVPVGTVTELPPPTDSAPASGAVTTDTSPEGAALRAYLALTTGYVHDRIEQESLGELQKQALALAKGPPGPAATVAAALAEAVAKLPGKDIAAQRDLLRDVSKELIRLLRISPPAEPLYIAYCPMVKADWVQEGRTVNNPYMGQEMPRCGMVTDMLKPRPGIDQERFATGYFCPITPDRLYDEPALCPVDKFPFKFVQLEKVLAVPQAAVINTGTRHIVYRETEPGVFDMLQVELGPRAGEFYPVVSGLKAGERIATDGAFLVDAENRLNPAAAAQYFGASGRPPTEPKGSGGHQH